MIELVAQKQGELLELCRRFQVDQLDLFGSAATGNFDPDSSDLDFLIEFKDRGSPGLLNRYLDFADALERLFNRHVDLLTQRAIRNPYFKKTIADTKQTIYDSRTQPAYP